MFSSLVILVFLVAFANAHMAVWNDGMYCRNGNQTEDEQDAELPCNPLYMLPKDQWWFHAVDNCDKYPPPDGEFLEIPANGNFTVQIATNRAFTTLSFDGAYTSDWTDGQPHLDAFAGNVDCLTDPNLHAQNESMAAGTAFAISYNSNLSDVTPENLVVFSIVYHTPWKRLTTYSVPDLPACPPDGCICAWGWVPNGCGEPNMYHQGFKCNVTGATSTTPLAVAQPAVWCEDDQSKCITGARQMIYWNQLDGNNIEVSGEDLSGYPKSPAYNQKLGFADGAQNDIFATQASALTSTISTISPTATKSSVAATAATTKASKSHKHSRRELFQDALSYHRRRIDYGDW